MQCVQKILCTGRCLVGFELHKHPACGPVDGHEQIAPAALVLHLGQVLHIHVYIAGLVALEGLVGLSSRTGLEVVQVASPMSAQAPVQARARDIRAQELPRDGKQVIQRKQQGAPQINHHGLLRGREHGLQVMGRMRAVAKDSALLPFLESLLCDPKALGQDTGSFATGSNLRTHSRGDAGILV